VAPEFVVVQIPVPAATIRVPSADDATLVQLEMGRLFIIQETPPFVDV
jgi:hypothetical protein